MRTPLDAWTDHWPSAACGVGRNAGDVYFISAYAPIHDEGTQTSTSEALRIEFWTKCLDGASGEVDTTLPWIGSAGSRIRVRCKKWTQLEVLRSNQLVAISTEASRQCWTKLTLITGN